MPFSHTEPSKSIRKTVTTHGKPLKASHSVFSRHKINEIKFYNSHEQFYEFTNFYPIFITVDGKSWPSAEHYFQAQKFVGTPYVEQIRKLPSARQAFQLSRDPAVSQWRRSDWDQVKDDVMLKVLRCKFDQCERLRSLLIGTGDKKLIEHTDNDSYWGDGGGPGKGLNKLGQLLMQVRSELNKMDKQRQKSGKSQLERSHFSLGSRLTRSKQSFADDTNLTDSPKLDPIFPRMRRSRSLSLLSFNNSPSTHVQPSSSKHHNPPISTSRTPSKSPTSIGYTKQTVAFTPKPIRTRSSSMSSLARPIGNDSTQLKGVLSWVIK